MNLRIVLIQVFALTAGCGGGGGSSGGPPAPPPKFLYASAYAGPNDNFASIHGFAVSASGALSAVPGSPVPTAEGGGPIAVTHDSKFLYTHDYLYLTQSGSLLAFLIHGDGSLTSAATGPSFSMPDRPAGLVAHPTADFLYLSSNSGVLTVFAIDSATGALNQTSSVNLGNQFINGSAVITPDGRYLYQSDKYPNSLFPTTSQIAGFSTNTSTGALSSVPGSPLSPTIHTGSSIGEPVIDPTGKFLYAGYAFTVVNVGDDGGVAAYSIAPASGELTAVPGSPFDAGGVPSSLTIDASGRFLIVSILPRLGGQGANCLAVLSIDPGTGALTSVPGSPFSRICGVLAADPSGPYVYVGAGGFLDAPPAPILVLSIDQATGALAPVGEATIPDTVGVSGIALTH